MRLHSVKQKKAKKPEYWHKIICILFAAVALYANSRELTWEYWIQTSLLAVPVMYIGYFAKQKWDVLDKTVTWYGTILSAAVILGILNRMPGSIELSVNQILHPALFYPVTLLGIYFCMGLAKNAEQKSIYRKILFHGRERKFPYHGTAFSWI